MFLCLTKLPLELVAAPARSADDQLEVARPRDALSHHLVDDREECAANFCGHQSTSAAVAEASQQTNGPPLLHRPPLLNRRPTFLIGSAPPPLAPPLTTLRRPTPQRLRRHPPPK